MAKGQTRAAIGRFFGGVGRFISAQVNTVLLVIAAIVGIPALGLWKLCGLISDFLSGEKIIFQACLKSLKSNFPLFVTGTDNPAGGATTYAYWQNEISDLEKAGMSGVGAARYDLSPLFRMELRLLEDCAGEVLQSRYWAINDRFERVMNPATVAKHNLALSNNKPETVAAMRADIGSMLCTIHNDYIFEIERERSVRRLKIFLFVVVILISLILVLFSAGELPFMSLLASPYTSGAWRSGMTAIFFSGVIGAFISIIQRMQTAVAKDALASDAIQDLAGLTFGYVGIGLALLSGGIFAEIIYLFMKSQIFSNLIGGDGVLFPSFSACQASPGAPCPHPVTGPRGLIDMAQALGMPAPVDLSKMLIWAFLAGFSERLVPDALDRLVATTDKKDK